jgi:(4S)-4-hydroxy-5-phosphonooxypentane-2,3-dione isomerase
MHVLVVTIDIKPGKTAEFLEAMLADARGSVANEPGCIRFDIIQDEQNPNRIYLYEVYRDKPAFEAHMKAPHFLTWQETVKDWFASPPVVGAGPNVFPPDADFNRNWKQRLN